jgi:surface antigen
MKKLLTACILIIATISTISCTNQDVGTVSGGVLGGLVGSQFGGGSGRAVAIGAGTLIGAYLGGKVGESMDEQDRARMNTALESNRIGQPAYWENSHTGTRYDVVPVRNVTVSGNQYCREYRTTAIVAGKRQQMYGTACRQPDGSWQQAN